MSWTDPTVNSHPPLGSKSHYMEPQEKWPCGAPFLPSHARRILGTWLRSVHQSFSKLSPSSLLCQGKGCHSDIRVPRTPRSNLRALLAQWNANTTHFASKSPSSPFGGTPKGIVFPKIGVSHDYIIQHSALPPVLGNSICLHLSWMGDWLFKLLLCLSTGTVPGSAPWEGSFGSVISELYPRAAYLAQKSYESPLF